MFLSRTFLISLFAAIALSACTKEDSEDLNEIELFGTLVKMSDDVMTTHMYGEFAIDTFAVRSSSIDLNAYVGEAVTAKGRPIEGYPLSGGPVYVEITEIAPLVLLPQE